MGSEYILRCCKIRLSGGTGWTSSPLSRMVVARVHELYLLERGTSARHSLPAGLRGSQHDIQSGAPGSVPAELRGARYDVVVNWIAFLPSDVERDLAWFA